MISVLDDCISLLVYVILPVLEKRGLAEDLRTPRLLKELKEYRLLVGEHLKNKDHKTQSASTGWPGMIPQEGSLHNTSRDDCDREIAINQLWYSAPKVMQYSPFPSVSPAFGINVNGVEWGENGDSFFRALAQTQSHPLGWNDVVEHMRFRLEMLVDGYQAGSTVSLTGSSALGVCDGTAEVDLLLRLPIFENQLKTLLTEKNELKKSIASLLPLDYTTITSAQFVLNKIQDCISMTRGTITQHINKLKRNPVDARQLSKLNADSELICKIGDRVSETSIKQLENEKNDNVEYAAGSIESKKLKVVLSTCEKNILAVREGTMGALTALVPDIGYAVMSSQSPFGKLIYCCYCCYYCLFYYCYFCFYYYYYYHCYFDHSPHLVLSY